MIRRQEGRTIAEVMIAMFVASVVTAAVASAMVSTNQHERNADEESESLGVLRSAIADVVNDTRAGRKVYADSTSKRLRIWVDSDRDNQQDDDEKITWELEVVGDGARLVRSTDAGGLRVVAERLLDEDVFTYAPDDPAVALVTRVSISLGADVVVGSNPAPRRIETEVRLRNAARG